MEDSTLNEPELIREMLGLTATPPHLKTIAVIGLSENPLKASHGVSAYMQRQGYRILPVNPSVDSVLGEKSYPSLAALPLQPDIVNVFRLPKFIPGIVDEMIALHLKNLWVQLGIVHEPAAARAEAAGIHVVMDRCILIEHMHLNATRT